MKIIGVITVYSSDPASAQLRTTIRQLQSHGLFVIIKPLSTIKQRSKQQVQIDPVLASSLAAMHAN